MQAECSASLLQKSFLYVNLMQKKKKVIVNVENSCGQLLFRILLIESSFYFI